MLAGLVYEGSIKMLPAARIPSTLLLIPTVATYFRGTLCNHHAMTSTRKTKKYESHSSQAVKTGVEMSILRYSLPWKH
jgi:hypothetical protein